MKDDRCASLAMGPVQHFDGSFDFIGDSACVHLGAPHFLEGLLMLLRVF
jgi:hypothetical protein